MADLRHTYASTVLYLAGLGSLLLSTVDTTATERCIAVGVIIVVAGVLDAAVSLAVRAAWRSVKGGR